MSWFLVYLLCFGVGCMAVSDRWKPIYDDRAQKTWVASDCLVVSREWVVCEARGHLDSDKYQVFIHVLRLAEHNASSYYSTRVQFHRGNEVDDFTVATIFDSTAGDAAPGERAVQWPHQAKYPGRSGKKMRELGAWYSDEDEANEFKNQYREGDVVTCYWDVDHPKKVAMTNDGGDWGVVYFGLVVLCAITVPTMICVLAVCFGLLQCEELDRDRGRSSELPQRAPAGRHHASRHADVPPPPQTRAPPNPDRTRAYSDEARAALRAIDDAAALRAQLRAIDTEGARDEPATWAEWFGFCANPDPEPATGQMPPQQGAVQTGVVGQPQQGVVMDQPQAPQGSVIQAQGKFVHSSQAPQGTVVGVETV